MTTTTTTTRSRYYRATVTESLGVGFPRGSYQVLRISATEVVVSHWTMNGPIKTVAANDRRVRVLADEFGPIPATNHA
jgi:hypothetical protein